MKLLVRGPLRVPKAEGKSALGTGAGLLMDAERTFLYSRKSLRPLVSEGTGGARGAVGPCGARTGG